MTEQDWLTADHPWPMLEHMKDKASDRRLRLFAAACCRRIWHLLRDDRSRDAMGAAEQFADATTNDGRRILRPARKAAREAEASRPGWAESTSRTLLARSVWEAARQSSSVAAQAVAKEGKELLQSHTEFHAALVTQVPLCRCIFGNPFRPIAFASSWRTPTTTSLAAAIYEERHLPSGRFDNGRLGVLADALGEAGCDNRDVLSHLRNGGEHARGCWVVDLVLGKE